MKSKIPYPLNDPQQRHVTVALMTLERHLAELRERLERGPLDLRLTHYTDAVDANEAATLLPAIRAAEEHLRTIAEDLGLPSSDEPVRRALVVALEFASIHLYECRPEHGLSGYGKVAPNTAEYLEREIPKLDAAVQNLIHALHAPAAEESKQS